MSKQSYIEKGFIEVCKNRCPEQSEKLISDMNKRLAVLRKETENESKAMKFHLESQILPGIATYETLSAVMCKEQALAEIHRIVELHSLKMKKAVSKAARFAGMYERFPKIFLKITQKTFGRDAGFDYKIYDTDKNTARLDMIKCPYHIMTVRYGCHELCVCFCDSDDTAYGDIHPKLRWHRTKTLGRGNDCCDFSLSYIKTE